LLSWSLMRTDCLIFVSDCHMARCADHKAPKDWRTAGHADHMAQEVWLTAGHADRISEEEWLMAGLADHMAMTDWLITRHADLMSIEDMRQSTTEDVMSIGAGDLPNNSSAGRTESGGVVIAPQKLLLVQGGPRRANRGRSDERCALTVRVPTR
jgi:hypothetical protein